MSSSVPTAKPTPELSESRISSVCARLNEATVAYGQSGPDMKADAALTTGAFGSRSRQRKSSMDGTKCSPLLPDTNVDLGRHVYSKGGLTTGVLAGR
jgi:hypothetical protein